jgi:antitoxin HicB
VKSKDSNTQNCFSFPAALTPDLDDGEYVVTFRDLPEAITQEDSVESSLQEAFDRIEEAIATRIDDHLKYYDEGGLIVIWYG